MPPEAVAPGSEAHDAPLPAPVRRRVALAAERAAEVDLLLSAVLNALDLDEPAGEGAGPDLDPQAANWRGRLQCLRADLAVPLWRALEKMRHRVNGQDRTPAGDGRRSGRARSGGGAAANSP